MPSINPTRQQWLTGLKQQLEFMVTNSGGKITLIAPYFDEPYDPAHEYPWEPCAIIKVNQNDNSVYSVLTEELTTDDFPKVWEVHGVYSTLEQAQAVVRKLRPWEFGY